MEKNNEEKLKKDIKRELISKDLSELMKYLVAFIFLIGIFGYIGYIYSVDNNENISHGIIIGCLFPLGWAILNAMDIDNILTDIIYAIIYICIADKIPTLIGAIILLIIIFIFVIYFIHIEKKDRNEEIERVYKNNQNKKNTTINNYNTQSYEGTSKPINIEDSKMENPNYYDDIMFDNENERNELENVLKDELYDEDIYECEVCFKRITREEYETYDCMCEDCFMDVHIDNDGNYHDEELF